MATEEPLEVRLHGQPFAVIMRTPGMDRELAAGFLLSEGVVRTNATTSAPSSTAAIRDRPEVHNIVDVYLLGERAIAARRASLDERRNVLTNVRRADCAVA